MNYFFKIDHRDLNFSYRFVYNVIMVKKDEKPEPPEKWKFYALAALIVAILTGAGVLSYEIQKSNQPQDDSARQAAELKSQVEDLNKKIDGLNQAIKDAKAETTTTTQTTSKVLGASTSSSSSSSQETGGKVNINTADLAGLDKLTGVGPVTAQAIIDYRNANGPFKSIDELDNVKGIGPATINKLRDQATI